MALEKASSTLVLQRVWEIASKIRGTANGTTHVDYCHGRCFDHHGSFTKTHCLDIYTSSARDAESRTPTVRKVFRAETKVRVEWYGVGGAGGKNNDE